MIHKSWSIANLTKKFDLQYSRCDKEYKEILFCSVEKKRSSISEQEVCLFVECINQNVGSKKKKKKYEINYTNISLK